MSTQPGDPGQGGSSPPGSGGDSAEERRLRKGKFAASGEMTDKEEALLDDFVVRNPFIARDDLITLLRRVDFDKIKGEEAVKRNYVKHFHQILPGFDRDDITTAFDQADGDPVLAQELLKNGIKSEDERAIDALMQIFAFSGLSRAEMTARYHMEGKNADKLGAKLLGPDHTPFHQVEEAVGSSSASAAVAPREPAVAAPELYTAEQLQNLQDFTDCTKSECKAALRQEYGNWDLACERVLRNKAAIKLDLTDEDEDEDEDDKEERSREGSDDSEPKAKKSSDSNDSNDSDSGPEYDDDLPGPSGPPGKKRRNSSPSLPDPKRPRWGAPTNGGFIDDNAKWADEEDDGVGAKLIFDDGDYPTRIRHLELWKIKFFAEYMDEHANNDENCTIEVPGIVCKDFKLVYDFVVTKKLRLDDDVYRGPESKLDGFIAFVKTATALGVRVNSGLEKSILSNIEKIMMSDRYVLHGRHIQFAYAFRKNPPPPGLSQEEVQDTFLKPLRELFVKSATKCYAMYRESPYDMPKGSPVYDSDDDIDVARRDAFDSGFRFDREMKRITEFKIDLLESFDTVWRGREWKNGDKSNSSRLFLDPLTHDRFECD